MSKGVARTNNNLKCSAGSASHLAKSNGVLCHEQTKSALSEKKDGVASADYGLLVAEVPPIFHEPFIGGSYRRVGLSAWKCCQSIFRLNNETFNVWTHILGLAFFLLHYPWVVFRDRRPFGEEILYPLVCFAFGISTVYAMSITAHTFNCMSVQARKICFSIDYAAIGFYTFTGGMAFYFYSRPVNTEFRLFNEPSLFLAISAVMSVGSTFVICWAMYCESPHRSKVIALTYATSWLFNTLPYTGCIFLAPSELNDASLHYFKRHCLLYAVGASVYIVNFPERLMAGVFDIFGHSHQFMHVLIGLGASDEFIAVYLDMSKREGILKEFPGPNVYNCFGLVALVMLANVALISGFSKGVFARERKEKEQ